jgi:hypothetical protein
MPAPPGGACRRRLAGGDREVEEDLVQGRARESFEFGLPRVLDGIQAFIEARKA